MNVITCKLCKTIGNVHQCPSRHIHGQVAFTAVVYTPNKSKANKQNLVPGYMKRFGSRAG